MIGEIIDEGMEKLNSLSQELPKLDFLFGEFGEESMNEGFFANLWERIQAMPVIKDKLADLGSFVDSIDIPTDSDFGYIVDLVMSRFLGGADD